ncbi:hypothetical protein BOW53_09805 [Solemya pervernicosa gill symbiont]|uniref:Uncharacterized protein n=1 Tax=Solemya pervernicosa gill symbiont TaxID=642797 RepID=A0A1T2L4P6_9GAMM|nr:hypothetical protein BOW53_09805 [Solemya pervernicosa gill symbiont]
MPILLLLPLPSLAAETLRPFSSDGCSLFPDGTLFNNELWLSCCVEHDLRYWRGGSYAERITADHALEQCVAARGEAGVAALMYSGVRIGGSPFWPTLYRWGYGWDFLRGYKPLSADELKQVERELARAGKSAN